MAKNFIIVLDDEDGETVMRVLNARAVGYEEPDDFLAQVNNETGELAHGMFEYLEEMGIAPGMDPHVENWNYQQLKEFHRLARANFDWAGARVAQARGWDVNQKQWRERLADHPDLTQEPGG